MTRYLHPVFIATARNMWRSEQVWRRMAYCRIDIIYFVLFVVFMAEEIDIFILFQFLFALVVLFVVFMAEEIDIAYFVSIFVCFICLFMAEEIDIAYFVCCVLFCFIVLINIYHLFLFLFIFLNFTVHQQSRRKLISKDATPQKCRYLVLSYISCQLFRTLCLLHGGSIDAENIYILYLYLSKRE